MPPGKSPKIISLWPEIMCLCKMMNGRKFFTSDHLENIQGGHIFNRLNSLSFPWDFQGIFKFVPEQLKREKFLQYIFICDYATYLTFSQSFPGFSSKIQISLSFPWDSDNFSNSLSFPGFPCFPGLWPPWYHLKDNCNAKTSWFHMKERSKCWRTICISLKSVTSFSSY